MRRPIAVAVLALLLPRAVLAAWPNDYRTPREVFAAPNDQYTTAGAMVADGAGGFYVACVNGGIPPQQLLLQRMSAAGAPAPGWPAAGVSLATNAGFHHLIADGSGGAIAVWIDYRNGRSDIFAQRVTGAGTLAPGWPAGGQAVATQPVEKPWFDVCADGAGGAFIAYDYTYAVNDVDVYAARLRANALVSTAFVNTFGSLQQHAVVSADGAGGCYIAFEDNSPGNFDLKASRLDAGMSLVFANKIICDHASDQRDPQIITSGDAAYVFWQDQRYGTYSQIFYDYVSSTGTAGYHFGFNLYSTTTNQNQVTLAPDNAGGFYTAWVDARPPVSGLYLKHFILGSTTHPGWPQGGVFVGPGTEYQTWYSSLTVDRDNGAIVAWTDQSTFSGAIYGAHVDAFGTPRPLTKPNGNLLIQDGAGGVTTSLVPDGKDGAFMTWGDYHSGRIQTWAQHLDPFLALGDPAPVSAGVRDIRGDQGGHVRVTWNASWMDNTRGYDIGSYWLWRQAPLTLAQAAAQTRSSATFRPATEVNAGYAWELVAQQPANQSAQYSYVSPMTSDSIAGHNPYTVFMVEAHAASDPRACWPSAPDSGYSVDNLGPAPPAPFLGTYASGNATLSWGPSAETDLAGYRLYRGASLGFVPDPGNRVASPVSTGYVDHAAPPSVYKLTAVDVHGNESPPTTLVPAGATGVDPGLPTELAFAQTSENPSRGATSWRLGLPGAAAVSLAIYDVLGREMRTIAAGSLAAGVHTLTWDGRTASGGSAPSGVYLARLRAGSRELVRRVAMAR